MHQNSKWKIPTSQSGNDSLTDQEKIQQLISAESPYETFVIDVIKDKNILVSKIGQYRKKKVTEYVKLFYDTLQKKQEAPQHNQTLDSAEQVIEDNSIGNTTTTSLQSLLDMQNTSSIGNSTSLSSQTSSMHQSMSLMNSTTADAPEKETTNHLSTFLGNNSQSSCLPLSPISLTHSANHLDDLTMSTSFMGESTHNDFPLMSVENDKKENSVLFFLKEDDYSFSHCNSATNGKPFHMFTNDDLQPQQCTAAFLYIVFRNPLLNESTFFKAGVRTFDESKQTFEQAKMENLRRYVTVFGPETEQFW